MSHDFTLWNVFAAKGEASSDLYIPTIQRDIQVQVFGANENSEHLLCIPDFKWCSNVYDFDEFSPSDHERKIKYSYDFSFLNTPRGYTGQLGDIEIDIPELEPYINELKLVLSLLCAFVYRNSNRSSYTFIVGSVDEHITYCIKELEEIRPTIFSSDAKRDLSKIMQLV
ncbi:hypothetical protein [Priestia aryabhattai]|uniref:hypothetical protein n=1 Tax=Priestia aryabhattai TaxID=412384 RepID=UPI0032E88711